ncbi:chloride channel protein [Aurantivibrio plasticivorans]
MSNQPRANTSRLKQRWNIVAEHFRDRLSYIDALPQLTFLGLIVGICAALLIVAFRFSIEIPLFWFLENNTDNFEGLSRFWHFALPAAGAIVIGIAMNYLAPSSRQVSVSHVLDRLHNHQGQLPAKNVAVQFFGGIASLVTGQSVGREGPAVHLGAGAASLLGQWLKLPNNSLRTLVGCGVAAAISASFNTPMAGVIFAMEVVLMEYTITGFIPVILASVSGAVISQIVFGEDPSIVVNPGQMNSLLEIPFMAFAGVVIGLIATLYLTFQDHLKAVKSMPLILRFACIGIVTGALALIAPQILGLGYDTLEGAMNGEIGLNMLLIIIAAKLVATAISTGLGMPGGVIGPMLVIGGCIGGVLGYVGNIFYPQYAADAGFYVTLGMAAMMGAVLNAPLAALMAVLELTYNPNAIFPSMVVIVMACVVSQQIFRREGVFVAQLRAMGTPLRAEPDRQVLSRAGVRSVMSTKFVASDAVINTSNISVLLAHYPDWIVLSDDDTLHVLRAADLAKWLDQFKEDDSNAPEKVNLLEIPGQRYQPVGVHARANLFEARNIMIKSHSDLIYVERPHARHTNQVMGIINAEMINNFYRN